MSAILVVDDESAMREFYRRLLVPEGHLILTAQTAEKALELLALDPEIPLVIADLQMPGHGGDWLIERIRERFPSVAVILATANQSVPGTVTLQPSVVNYIVKPISREQLIAAVNSGLAWRERSEAPQTVGDDGPIEQFLDSKLNRNRGDGDKRG